MARKKFWQKLDKDNDIILGHMVHQEKVPVQGEWKEVTSPNSYVDLDLSSAFDEAGTHTITFKVGDLDLFVVEVDSDPYLAADIVTELTENHPALGTVSHIGGGKFRVKNPIHPDLSASVVVA
jgi:hypothetical protein